MATLLSWARLSSSNYSFFDNTYWFAERRVAISLSLLSHDLFSPVISLRISSIATEDLWICILRLSVSERNSTIDFRPISSLILPLNVAIPVLIFYPLLLFSEHVEIGFYSCNFILQRDKLVFFIFELVKFFL